MVSGSHPNTIVIAVDSDRDPIAQTRFEMSRKIVAALEQLATYERAALCFRDAEGLPLSAVADKLDCSIPAAKRHIARGRIKLVRSRQGLPASADRLSWT